MTMNLSSCPTVTVEHVSKMYKLFQSPSHRVKEALHPKKKKYHTEFWALKDVNFDIQSGEIVGIIGSNGSGKSTILQIICGALHPTKGNVTVNGRKSELLELGAGFHPELTGRENILLNGSFRGFSRSEMQERVPQIEEFADIGQFIDHPVKTYSSGMFVRLAFAGAIYVDPDILIIDEALAVGDPGFQRKCFRKLENFFERGKTVLFVSHDLSTINSLCNRALLLDKGALICAGEPKHVTRYFSNMIAGTHSKYDSFKDPVKITDTLCTNNNEHSSELKRDESTGSNEYALNSDAINEKKDTPVTKIDIVAKDTKASIFDRELRYGNAMAEIIDSGIYNGNQARSTHISLGKECTLYCRVCFYKDVRDVRMGFHLVNVKGQVIYGTHSRHKKICIPPLSEGDIIEAKFSIPMILTPGAYFASFGVTDQSGDIVYDRRIDAIQFDVVSDGRDYKIESMIDLNAKIVISVLT